MDKSFLSLTDNKITLNSYLDEKAFGHTDLGKKLDESGFLVKIFSDRCETCSWNFETITTGSDGLVRFEGEFKADYTLEQDFSEENGIAALKACDLFISSNTFEENNYPVLPGAGGIVINRSSSEDCTQVLLLPGRIVDECTSNSRDYGEIQGKYLNKGLERKLSALFTRAVIAYRIYTKRFPFTETDLEKRQEDITDRNFIPSKYQVPAADLKLCEIIDAGLSVKGKKRIAAGEKRFQNEKAEKLRLLNVARAELLTSESVAEGIKGRGTEEDASFVKSKTKFTSRQTKIIKTVRFYRRNNKRIGFCAVIMIAALYTFNSFHKTNMKKATSMGLTSIETVETLYTGMARTDVTVVDEVIKGKNMKPFSEAVTIFYLENRQPMAWDPETATLTPSQWLFFEGKKNYRQFGITNFMIDGKDANVEFNYPVRKDRKKPLGQQEGINLVKGQTITHQVSYNLIQYRKEDAEETLLSIIRKNEEVTLKWTGKKWIAVDTRDTKEVRIDTIRLEEYKASLKECIENSGNDLHQAFGLMRTKYNFIPREDELKAGGKTLYAKYKIKAAGEY